MYRGGRGVLVHEQGRLVCRTMGEALQQKTVFGLYRKSACVSYPTRERWVTLPDNHLRQHVHVAPPKQM